MATHFFSILFWNIPWIGEPGRLWSVASQKNRSQLSNRMCQQQHTFYEILSQGKKNNKNIMNMTSDLVVFS